MDISVQELIERIKEKISAKELETIGINQKTLSAWKVRNSYPRSDDLFKIAQHIGVSMEYLLTGEKMYMDELFLSEDEKEKFILSGRERKLLEDYKLLSEKEKKGVSNLVEALTGKVQI